jgi:plasmid replication initiation protein
MRTETNDSQIMRITKSNILIEANYSLSLQEQRLILCCIALIDPRLPLEDQRVFLIHAAEFQARFGMPREKAYEELREIGDRIFERKVVIQDPRSGTIEKIRWVSKAQYMKGQGAIQVYFAPEILPYLSQLKASFTSYNFAAVANFSSTFAIRLYEIIGQYRSIGRRLTAVDDLRRWLDCTDTFTRFTDFERWAVRVGVEQINKHSDLRVTYRKVKQGRAVSHFEFTFTAITQQVSVRAPQAPVAKIISESVEETDRLWREQMKVFGVNPDAP